jgi:hypothetical protein
MAVIRGTQGPDILIGTLFDDSILGLSGNDRILADLTVFDFVGGDNEVNSGSGNDTVRTADGDDRIEAGLGNHDVRSGRDEDTVLGQAGDDELRGGEDDDDLRGGAASDRGDRAHRAGVVPPAARPEADVVAIQPAASARVGGRHGGAAVRAAHQPPERRRGPGARLVAPALGVGSQYLVHPIPGRAVDDRLVLARVALALVDRLTDVGAVAQDLVERALVEWPTLAEGEAADHRRHAAQAAARRPVEAIERQARERAETGLALDGLPDLSAEGERDGFYRAQLIRELAVRHITGWTGVQLEGGPAPPTPENVAAVMELYLVGEGFFQEFTLRQVLLNAAKTDPGPLLLAFPAGRRARVLPSLLRGRPALRPRRARSGRTALPLPGARLDQLPGA